MSVQVKRVVAAFLAGKARKAGNVRTDGERIYSYAMAIAWRLRHKGTDTEQTALVTYRDCPTVTTKQHQRAVAAALSHSFVEVRESHVSEEARVLLDGALESTPMRFTRKRESLESVARYYALPWAVDLESGDDQD